MEEEDEHKEKYINIEEGDVKCETTATKWIVLQYVYHC